MGGIKDVCVCVDCGRVEAALMAPVGNKHTPARNKADVTHAETNVRDGPRR